MPVNAQSHVSWFIKWEPRVSARRRLFCFPYAGGSPTMFKSWAARLPGSLETIGVCLPGRDGRFSEPAFAAWSPLIEALMIAFTADSDRRPSWFFGHSLGATVAYELATALRDAGLPGPQRLILAGCRSPEVPLRAPPIANLPRSDFFAQLLAMNSRAKEILSSPAFMGLLEPTLRADTTLAEIWTVPPDRSTLDVPITIFSGSDDPIAAPADMEGWRNRTTAEFSSYRLAGDHFFLHGSEDAILAVLSDLSRT